MMIPLERWFATIQHPVLRSPRTALWVALLMAPSFLRADAPEKVTYEDHVKPIFRNRCASCHNPEEKNSNLDVMTYSSVIAGGASGQVLAGSNPDSSRLWKLISHSEEPKMPPDSAKIPDAELELVKKWIEGGLLDKADSKAVMSGKPKANIALVAAAGQPTGPVVLPKDLLLEPVVHLERGYAVSCIATSPWAPVIALAAPKQVLLYHSETLELLGVLPFPEGFPQVLKFSRSGTLLLVGGGRGGQNGLVALFDVATGERMLTVGDEYDSVLAADISSDQQQIALGGPGKLVRIYSTKTGELIRSIKKHTDWVTAIEFSPDAVLLASGDRGGGLYVWEAYSGQLFYTLNGHKGGITDVSWRPDSNVLASASEDHTVWLWEMFNGTAVKNWSVDNAGALSLEFTRDGRLLTSGREHNVKMWDGEGKGLRTFEPFADLVTAATFNHDGTRVIAGDWTGEIRVWKADDGTRIGNLTMAPPTLAQRIAEVDAQLGPLQANFEKLAAALNVASEAQSNAKAAADAAKQMLSAAQTVQQQVDAQLAERRAVVEAAIKTRAQAEANLTAQKNDTKAKDDAFAAEKMALDQSSAQLTAAQEAVTVQSKLVEQLSTLVANARQLAQQGTLNGSKIEATAAVIEQALTMAKEAMAVSQKERDAKSDEVTKRTNSTQAAEVAAKSAKDLLLGAEKSFTDATTTLQTVQSTLPEIEKNSVTAKAKVDELTPIFQTADQAFQNAVAAGTQAKAAADGALVALEQARKNKKKWEIGQVRVTLYKARDLVAEKEKFVAERQGHAAETQKNLDTVSGAIASLEKFLADGPVASESAKNAIAQAQAGINAANVQVEMAKGVLAKKEALRGDFATQANSIQAAAQAEPENESLKNALAKANETLGLLIADRDQAIKGVEAKQVLVQKAVEGKTAAEAALANLQKQIAETPGKIEEQKKTLAEVTAAHQKKQADLEAARQNSRWRSKPWIRSRSRSPRCQVIR